MNLNFTACDNASTKNEIYREFIICGVFSGIFSIFGLFTNFLCALVYRHRRLRSAPINWYFTALSVSDFFVCSTSCLLFSMRPIAAFLQDGYWILCSRVITKHLYPFSLIFQTTSVWLTVSVAIYRFLGICFPLKTLHIVTPLFVKKNIVLVVVMSVFYNLPRFFEIGVSPCLESQSFALSAQLLQTRLRTNPMYKLIYVTLSYNLFMVLVPVTLLISVNTAIMNALRSSSKFKDATYASVRKSNSLGSPSGRGVRFRASANGTNSAKSPSSNSERSVSIMLVILVFFFLFCNIVPLVANILEILVEQISAPVKLRDAYYVMVDLGNLMATVNSSMNIFIYFFYGQHFKAVLKRYFQGPLSCFRSEQFDPIPTIDRFSAMTNTSIRRNAEGIV